QPVETIDVPQEPVAIRTKTDPGFGIKYVTLYWRINTDLGTFQLPAKFRNAKPLWYPAGKVVNLPISLQFKNPDITSPASTYSFVLNSPYATPGHIMPYAQTAWPHNALSIVNEGSNYWGRWHRVWGDRNDDTHVLPRINKFPKNISKVFWSAPSLEWTTHDGQLNDIFFLNRAIPTLTSDFDNSTGYQRNTKNLTIQTGLAGGGTRYNGGTWNILYVKNKEHNQQKPDLSKVNLTWDFNQQKFSAPDFESKNHKSSWIVSITSSNGLPLLYDPLNYYAMLGPFWPPELPEN
ncbi:hypothetical protein Q4516_03800, partial [Mesomycoplasma ovipneumoniae]|uniref:hypothetical protein n=1 Tax=Mesomycoplasma ovipneumoniae TaxID=29562 RepID=UPI0026E2651C